MKLAALILVHRFPKQVEMLINTLLADNKLSIYVHVDLKSPDVFDYLSGVYNNNSRVKLINKRYKVYWGSYGQIRATCALLESANSGDFDYAFLISGQDFPIKPIASFREFLEKNHGKQFLVNFKLPDMQWEDGGLNRLRLFHFDSQKHPWLMRKINGLLHRIQRFTGLYRPLQFELYGGSNWFTLSKSAVELVCSNIQHHPEVLSRFRFTRCADEMFVQTILVPLLQKEQIISDDLRMIDWGSGPEFPRIWRISDFGRLVAADNKFFARKFDPEIDAEILDRLKQHASKHQ